MNLGGPLTRRLSCRLFVFAALLGAVALACESTSSAPAPTPGPTAAALPTSAWIETEPAFSPTFEPPVSMPAAPTAAPAILQPYLLALEWPAAIRLGDSDVIRLTLTLDEAGRLTPSAEYAGHLTSAQALLVPDVYAAYTVIAEARLDLAGVQVAPDATFDQPLARGQGVTFAWSVHPNSVGHYRGVAWFYLRYKPLAGGDDRKQALAALPVEFDVPALFGLNATVVRLLGGLGAVVSTILGLPFLEEILRWLWKRLRRG